MQRSRDRLAEAILRLAPTREVGRIPVAELAREAGVHRSTVYEHAESPAGLLRLVLRGELDEARRTHLAEIEPSGAAAAIRGVTLAVLEHVERHDEVYRRALGSHDEAALHAMLSAHFRESTLQLFEHGAVVPPVPEGERDVVARFLADGWVGAIDAWLQTPAPRDRERLLELSDAFLPAWWPRA